MYESLEVVQLTNGNWITIDKQSDEQGAQEPTARKAWDSWVHGVLRYVPPAPREIRGADFRYKMTRTPHEGGLLWLAYRMDHPDATFYDESPGLAFLKVESHYRKASEPREGSAPWHRARAEEIRQELEEDGAPTGSDWVQRKLGFANMHATLAVAAALLDKES